MIEAQPAELVFLR